MTSKQWVAINPELDLVLEREIDVTLEQVWAAWTDPEQLKQWFTPRPWQTTEARLDVRPGGEFYTVMRSPEGEEFPNAGCYLEVVPNERLVWTDALLPGYRPADVHQLPFAMTAMLLLEPIEGGTRYTAIAIHTDAESRGKHEEMGFYDGWGTVADQLVEYIKGSQA